MKTLKAFYMDQQTAKKNDAFSPSAIKPALVLKSWQDLHLPIEVVPFEPLTERQIGLAHSKDYVRQVLSLKQSNGFGNRLPEVRDSLPYTTGSMAHATLHSYKTGEVTASLTSGFHHACWNSGGGFCTFNGLIIAAQTVKLAGAKKVGILDCDQHDGNGTTDIIDKLSLDFPHHYTFGAHGVTAANAERWLKDLPKIVDGFKECKVLIFQAGADPHIDDPLGGVLTTDQLMRRDNIVFTTAKRLKIPIAFNLAGGYQEPLRKVLDLHDITAQECVRVMRDE